MTVTLPEPPLYPLFLRLHGRRVLVVGGGPVACEKAQQLAEAGADILVVAPHLVPELERFATEVQRRPFCAADVDNAWMVVAAATPEVNRTVREAADARRVFIVAVDDVASCTAFGAARLRRGGITVAISSDGRAPALVALLRRALDSLVPDDLGAWREIAERARDEWKRDGISIAERRPLLLKALNALYAVGGSS